MADQEESAWKLDKRINIPFIGAVLLQTAVIVGFAQNLNDRVTFLERTTVSTEQYGRLDEKMSTLKDNYGSMSHDMQSIKDDMRRMAVRGKP